MVTLVIQNSSGSIEVEYKATLKDPDNLNEQFQVDRPINLNTYLEQSLFYFWTRGVPWTLNELVFFCINNNLCLGIFDSEGTTLLQSYGICGGVDWRIFDDTFDDTFA